MESTERQNNAKKLSSSNGHAAVGNAIRCCDAMGMTNEQADEQNTGCCWQATEDSERK